MRVIAHRGFAQDAPENTVAAIRRASHWADTIEFDVRRCGSGELVVFHDALVDELTDGTGLVRDHTLAELQSLSVKNSEETIPTLEDVLQEIPPDVDVNVELKETGLAADALVALQEVDNDAIVSSFSSEALKEVREHDASIELAYISKRVRDEPVRRAVELDCQYVHPHFFMLGCSRLLSRAQSVDLDVNVWTVNDPITARFVAWNGVDGIATDRLSVANPYL